MLVELPFEQQGELTPTEAYAVEDSVIVRTVRMRNGSTRRSEVIADSSIVGRSVAPRDAFDAGWLRSLARPPVRRSRGKVRVVDLFAGCGGLSLGVWEACRALELRMEPVWAVDTDHQALSAYAANFPGAMCDTNRVEAFLDGELGRPLTLSERRLRKRLGDVDMVIGGPPCQGHSDLNNHTRRDDPRNELYLRMARFCEVLSPRHVIIENVPGVLRDRSASAQRTWAVLTSLGYDISTGTINASDVGVAQSRRRNLTIGSLDITPSIAVAVNDAAASARPLLWAIDDLRVKYDGESLYDSAPIPDGDTKHRIDYLFTHGLHDLPDDLRPDCHRLRKHTYRSNYGRMFGDRPAQTITTGFGVMGKGRFVHPLERRTITPHEAARIQFFPDFFTFPVDTRTQIQKLIGNAVPPKLGYAIGLHLLR